MGAPHSPMQHSLHGAHQVHKLRVDLGVTHKHGRDENRDPATANKHIGRSETSALPPKADMFNGELDVCSVP